MSIETNPTEPRQPLSSESGEPWMEGLRRGVRARLFGSDTAAREAPSGAPAGLNEDPTDPKDPTRIGRYVVIKRIGAGGMGLVYAAYDDALDRKVAVKLLRPERLGPGAGQERLLREAQAIARLSHANVVHVYEVGTHDDQVYVAMEYIDGMTLKRWQRKQNWRAVLGAYLAAGRGLAAAHKAGIVHRDFKPDNVLVGHDGGVHVLDFGLAQTDDPATSNDADLEQLRAACTVQDTSLTHTGTVLGTPAYMAPEQHIAGPVDHRTDQFSFCVALFEGLYGFPPFAGETLEELRHNVLNAAIESRPRFTEVPAQIQRVLERGLEVDRIERYDKLVELLDELAPPPPPRRWIWRLLAAGTLAIGMGGLLWWNAREDADVAREGREIRAQFEQTRRSNAEQELLELRLRTVSQRWDDLVLAYAQQHLEYSPSTAVAALKHLTTDVETWLPAARAIANDVSQRGLIYRQRLNLLGVQKLKFTPDNDDEVCGIAAGGALWCWNIVEDKVRVFDAPGLVCTDFAHLAGKGELLATSNDGNLYRFAPSGSLLGRPMQLSDVGLTAIASSPDTRRVVVADQTGSIFVLDSGAVRGNGATLERKLAEHTQRVSTLVFARNSDVFASGSDDGEVRLWYLDRDTHVTMYAADPIKKLQWQQDQDVLVVLTTDGTVMAWNTKGELQQPPGDADVADLALARDSHAALYATQFGQLTVAFDGSDPIEIEQYPGNTHALAISPSGRFAVAAKGDIVQAWRTSSDTYGRRLSGEVALTAQETGRLTAIVFRDHQEILSASQNGKIYQWLPQASPQLLADAGLEVATMQLAPDQHQIALEDKWGGLHVWDLDQPDGLRTLGSLGSQSGQVAFAWSPASDEIAKLTCRDTAACQVAIYPTDGRPPTRLGRRASGAYGVEYSPDGRYLLSRHVQGLWWWDLETHESVEVDWRQADANGQHRRRIASAFAGGSTIRVATVEDSRNRPTDRQELVVWQTGRDNTTLHRLFTETALRQLVADDARTTLLIQTNDTRCLLWFLDEDFFRVLPSVPDDITRLRVAPDRSNVLLEYGGRGDNLVINVNSGHSRRLPPISGPIAWSPGGTLADIRKLRTIRHWMDPSPSTPESFLAWLDQLSGMQIDASKIR